MSRMWSILIAVLTGTALLVAVPVAASAASKPDGYGFVEPTTGRWHLFTAGSETHTFFFGNPGDYPFMGDWDCDGIDTPGAVPPVRRVRVPAQLQHRRVSPTSRFFFGNPGDVPIAGDFNGERL
jgi:hypothetical protein